jgi:hypothetical protein
MDMTHLLPRVPDFAALTFRKSGWVCLHQLTVDRCGLLGTQFLNLHFDPIELTLQIRPSMEESQGSYKVVKQRSGALVVYARKFLHQIGILNGNGSRVLPVKWDRVRGLIVVQL